jgi:hypothetical protein
MNSMYRTVLYRFHGAGIDVSPAVRDRILLGLFSAKARLFSKGFQHTPVAQELITNN